MQNKGEAITGINCLSRQPECKVLKMPAWLPWSSYLILAFNEEPKTNSSYFFPSFSPPLSYSVKDSNCFHVMTNVVFEVIIEIWNEK